MRISVTNLQYEHGIIHQALEVLSEVIKNHKVEDKSKDMRELLIFLYDYVDHFHQNKEEQLFFPVILQHFPYLKKDIDNIFAEHRQIRKLFKDALGTLERNDWKSFNIAGMELIHHKIADLEREENHIFAFVDENLPLDVDESLNQSYAHYSSLFGEDYLPRTELFLNEIQYRLLGPGFFHQGIY